MKRDSRGVRYSVWLYTKLLALYPLSFQQQYGREMALTFRDVCRLENGRFGVSGLTGLWFEIFIDLASSVLLEHTREVRMVSERQGFIRLAGILGALGGVLLILEGLYIARAGFGEDPSAPQAALLMLAFFLVAVGSSGLFLAGRHERDVNAALGVLLFGALLGGLGAPLIIADIGLGWTMWVLAWLVQGAGLILLGATARQNPGFLRPARLLIILGVLLLAVLFASMGSIIENDTISASLLFGTLGVGWALLGLLLLSGNVRTDGQPPTLA